MAGGHVWHIKDFMIRIAETHLWHIKDFMIRIAETHFYGTTCDAKDCG